MGSSLYFFFLLFVFYFQPVSSLSFRSSNSSSSSTLCHHDERLALIHFKNSFSIHISGFDSYYSNAYPKTETWKEGTDCCRWDGVKCDIQTGFVIELNLFHSMLYGPFHSNSTLFFLHHLQKLDLSFNYFSFSKLPSMFGKFSYLTHLNLSHSFFGEEVPSEISQLSNLVSLDLSANDLSLETATFSQLAQNLTKLRELDLTVLIMSSVSPKTLLNLSSLSTLRLGSCFLQGKFLEYVHMPRLASLDLTFNSDLLLESTVFSNLTNLRELDMSGTDMSLVSPDSFSNLSSLSSLILSACELRGKFLVSDNFPNLISLDLSGNDNLILETFNFFKLQEIDLSYVNMSYASPDSFMNFSSTLSSLNLKYCELRGKFPATFLQRPNLLLLDLEGNPNITEFAPPMANWSNSNSLKYLSLRGCNFVGSNLAFIGNLTQLSVLDLSFNNFRGTEIPYSFGNIVKLTRLELSFCNLSGQIPSSLGNLKQLISLVIENNNLLNGPIPNSFGNLTRLENLYLRNNGLTGPIPSQLGRLSSLTDVDLSNNFLSETIPFSFYTLPSLNSLDLHNNLLIGGIAQSQHYSSHLSIIDLSNNKLHGPIPTSIFKLASLNFLILSSNENLVGQLSSSICKLKNLQVLDLSNNSFGGLIPKCIAQFSNNLEVLHLGMNYFNGTIPPTFSKRNMLRYISFNGNKLQGPIPPSIINCRSLEVLDLGDNKIIGTFPFFLGALPQLKVLVLRSNKLHGLVANFSRKYSFPKLQIVDLSNNNLSGPLPSEYFDHLKAMMIVPPPGPTIKYMTDPSFMKAYGYSVVLTVKGNEMRFVEIQTILTTIDFSQNKFTGETPKSIGKLKALIYLNLSHNCLTSKIQPSLGNLINLESLDLSSNSLVGRIPDQLVDLNFLQVFRVSNNKLEGPIPTGKQFNTFDSSSYEGNVGLCGFPLKKECGSDETQQLNPPKEEASPSENGFGWKAVLEGYGCGVIFGIVVGFVIFRTRKSSWFVRMVEAEGYLWRRKFDKLKNTPRSYRRRN